MTNNFLSNEARYLWKLFRGKCFWSGTNRQLKGCKTVSVFLRRVWAPVSVANVCAKHGSRGYASREHTECRLSGFCMCVRRLANFCIIPARHYTYLQITLSHNMSLFRNIYCVVQSEGHFLWEKKLDLICLLTKPRSITHPTQPSVILAKKSHKN